MKATTCIGCRKPRPTESEIREWRRSAAIARADPAFCLCCPHGNDPGRRVGCATCDEELVALLDRVSGPRRDSIVRLILAGDSIAKARGHVDEARRALAAEGGDVVVRAIRAQLDEVAALLPNWLLILDVDAMAFKRELDATRAEEA